MARAASFWSLSLVWKARFNDVRALMTVVPKGRISEDLRPGHEPNLGRHNPEAHAICRSLRCPSLDPPCTRRPGVSAILLGRFTCSISNQRPIILAITSSRYGKSPQKVVSPPQFEARTSPAAWHAPCPPVGDANDARSLARMSKR